MNEGTYVQEKEDDEKKAARYLILTSFPTHDYTLIPARVIDVATWRMCSDCFHLSSASLELLDRECFSLGHGAELDLGAHGRGVADVVDFPEELGNSVGPFAHYFLAISISEDLSGRERGRNGGSGSRYSHT